MNVSISRGFTHGHSARGRHFSPHRQVQTWICVTKKNPHPRKTMHSDNNGHDVLPEVCCAICLSTMHPGTTAVLPCGHTFHDQCIANQVESVALDNCPLCRMPFYTDCHPPNFIYEELAEKVLHMHRRPVRRRKHSYAQSTCFIKRVQKISYSMIQEHYQTALTLVKKRIEASAAQGRQHVFCSRRHIIPPFWKRWRRPSLSYRIQPIVMRMVANELTHMGFRSVTYLRAHQAGGIVIYVCWDQPVI